MIKINILTENRAKRRGMLGEHGLSILIEVDGFKVLLDAGQTSVFSFNAEKAGADLATVDALVVSHGHYDHTGGVPEFCRLNSKAPIYIHPDAFCERYNAVRNNPIGDCIGIPWKNNIDSVKNRLVFVKEPVSINENIMLSGTIPVYQANSSTNFVKKNLSGIFENDTVADEQFLIVKGKMGLYIFVGCSHPGVLNCVTYAKKLFPDQNIYALIGGMHLEKYTDAQLSQVTDGLKSEDVLRIMPLHCTGVIASCYLKNVFGDKCLILNSGDELTMEE